MDARTLDELIDDALASGDYSAAVERLMHTWPEFVAEDGLRVRTLLERLPPEVWQNHPWLVTAYGSSYRTLGSHSRTAALPYFEAARAIITDETPIPVRVAVALHYSALLRSLGRFDEALAQAEEAGALAKSDLGMSLAWRIQLPAKASLQAGIAHYHLGDYDSAFACLRLAAGLAHERLFRSERVECYGALALVEYARANFAASIEAIAMARKESGDSGLLESAFGAGALIAELLISVEQNRLSDAERLAPVVAAACERSDWEPMGFYSRAAITIISEQYVEGLDLLRQCLQAYRTWTPRGAIVTMSEGLRATLLLRLGEIDTAWDILGGLTPTQHHANCPARFIAHLRFISGDIAGTLGALRGCEALGDTHSGRTLVDVMMLKSAANYQLGHAKVSDVAFDRGLILAANNNMRIPFRLVPEAVMAELLPRAMKRPQPSEVRVLLDEVREIPSASTAIEEQPLSERERDILRALVRDLSVSEISEELYISVNTVKSHLKNAYRKLGVSTRSAAIKRARGLGLQVGSPTGDPPITRA